MNAARPTTTERFAAAAGGGEASAAPWAAAATPTSARASGGAGTRDRRWLVALCAAGAVGLTVTASPNGWLGSAMGKMVIFSAVSGRVLQDGKPVAGATVEREFDWVWGKETGKDATTTGPGGEFSLPRIERTSFLGSILPHEPIIGQTLTIRHGGKAYEAWLHDKRNYRDNGEVGGRPLRLVCRLEAAPSRHDAGYYGLCELE